MPKSVEFERKFWYDTRYGGVVVRQIRMGLAALLTSVLCVGCATAVPEPGIVLSDDATLATSVTVTTESVTTDDRLPDDPTAAVTTGATASTAAIGSDTTSSWLAPTRGTTTRVTTTTRPTALTTTAKQPTTSTTTAAEVVPEAPDDDDEMRGAWVSYIELDELFKRCSTPAQARKALDDMMETLASFQINTVFFHVRANSDAYYHSDLFSPAASVKKLLNAGFDPLSYAITAAHAKGIRLHAWVNPYRVGKQTAYLVEGIPTLTDASGRYYYVPTAEASQALILNGIREILNHYAVDGIQYDDYFYPEGLLTETAVYGFESADYEAYRQSGGTLAVGDWRRAGVDVLIAGTHTLTAAKGVLFGVSPAINAENTYDKLFADCRKWLSQPGYVDYLCPQIYTGFEHSSSAFDKMVTTWCSYSRHASVKLYFGLALYKIGLYSDTYAGAGKTEWATHGDVMKRSVQYLRDKQIGGWALYSYSYLDPASKSGLSKTADVEVAKQEVQNLRTII